MSTIRKIAKTNQAVPTVEGAGVHLKRGFGFAQPERFDPFLLLDDFRADSPAQYKKGFPWHPHRGIETITYVLQGKVAHGDSLGNTGIIGPGDVQWMSAGSGIIHQEMPQGDEDGTMGGFQLWLNLSSKDKMSAPQYREIKRDSIPEVSLPQGVLVKIVCGQIGSVKGPVENIGCNPQYLDVAIPRDATFRHNIARHYTAIAYVIAGSGKLSPHCQKESQNTTLALYDLGEEVVITAGEEGIRLLLFCGRPFEEPIAWQGPIVMNSREELAVAFEEYRRGTFLKDHG